MSKLFEKLGGEAAVNAAVDIFYGKVLADQRIKHFFVGVDMDRMRAHQKRFLTYAFGGSADYDGKSMRAAHTRLVEEMGLDDGHFDAVLDDLGAALRDLKVSEELIDEVVLVAESVRDDVLCR